jgi:hypothetical protein
MKSILCSVLLLMMIGCGRPDSQPQRDVSTTSGPDSPIIRNNTGSVVVSGNTFMPICPGDWCMAVTYVALKDGKLIAYYQGNEWYAPNGKPYEVNP